MIHITKHEFELLRKYIEEQCGILLDNNKTYLIENRLSNLVKEAQCKNFGEFYVKIKNDRRAYEIRDRMIEAITTNETLWFRDKYPYSALMNIILPAYYEDMTTDKRSEVRIWSAGCASGQEPYSIAITILEFFRKISPEKNDKIEMISILGTDISSTSLSQAMKAIYDDHTVKRGLLPGYLDRYFRKVGNHWAIETSVKQLITFKQYNLQDNPHRLGKFDVIFLRNVMIYFSDELKSKLLDRIRKMLNSKGYVFLGTGETVYGCSHHFDIVKHEGGILYQLKV